MSSQITHSQTLPKNVDYWDYYILCRCDDAVSKVLQRMEFWDGTKVGGNGHGEQINDNLKESKRAPTQDTSRFVYKTREELAWELIGAVKERSAYEALDTLANTLHYLKSRHNPYKTFDRTLQYEFQVRLVQKHLDDLYIIIKCFIDHGRQCRPILYAIEQLTQEGVYINRVEQKDGTLDGTDTLTIAAVAERLSLLHKQMHIDEEEGQKKLEEGQKKHKPLLPTFLKQDLRKDEANEFDADFPLCKNAQCIHAFLHNASGRFCTIDCANLHGPLCKNAQAIPVITTEITNSNYNTERENDGVGSIEHNTPPLTLSQEEINLILSLRSQNTLSHQGSEQLQPTVVGSTQDAHPFDATVPGSGDSVRSSSGEVSSTPAPSNSAQGSATQPVAEDSRATLSGVSNSASQRENEASTTPSIEASELHIAGTTSNAAQSSKQEKLAPKPRTRKPSVEKPVQPTEPDLSSLSEQEQQVYAMLRTEDKLKYLAYSPAKREVYNNWLGSYGFAVSVDITPKFDECLDRALLLHPAAEEFKNWRATLKKQDNEKPPEKRYFKNRNPQIWDVMRDIASLRETIDTTSQKPGAKVPTSLITYMTRDEACKLAHDVIEQGKQFGYEIQAQAETSKKNPSGWIVRVQWKNEYNMKIPAIKSLEHWQSEFNEMHEALSFEPLSMKREAR